MFKKKIVSFLLILSFITPFFYLPYQAQKAQAFLGFGDLVIDIKALAERIIDGAAMIAAQTVIDRIVNSTVKWAQDGFEGNPAYVTDPKQYFTDIADGVAGEFIQKDLGYLCSPFQANIRLSLTKNYAEPRPFECTLTEVVGNIEAFYDDFSQGGWDAWFSMTQNSANNPYGAYLSAKIELDSRIASAVGLNTEELDRNQGFLSWSSCTTKNPEPWISDPGTGGLLPSRRPNPAHVQGKAVGECIKRGPTETPGSVIADQLNEVLPTGLNKLVTAVHIEQMVNALISGLLQKYVFSSKGLFSRDNKVPTGPGTSGAIDIDGDRVPDGLDYDSDGVLDVCYFGGPDGTIGPPCLGSKDYLGPTPQPGGQCSAEGSQYAGDLRSAMDAVLEENPDVANLPNTTAGGRQNARTFLALVEEKLISLGFNATDEVLNGNNNPSTGDIIAVWREGDEKMERYDAISGSAETIGEAAMTDFAGLIPLNCTSSGGGNDCACENTGTPPNIPPTGGGSYPPGSSMPPEVNQTKEGNNNWTACAQGFNELACHKFVRDVAKALAAKDSNWGLLSKGPGENQCTLEACGRNVSGGYAADAIAYKYGSSESAFSIYDIISGVEGSNPGTTWTGPQPRRSTNFWAPVP